MESKSFLVCPVAPLVPSIQASFDLSDTTYILQAKRIHISMCIRTNLDGSPGTVWHCLLMLLDKLASTLAENAGSSPIVKSISQVLPGKCHASKCGCPLRLVCTQWLQKHINIQSILVWLTKDYQYRQIYQYKQAKVIFMAPRVCQVEQFRLLFGLCRCLDTPLQAAQVAARL